MDDTKCSHVNQAVRWPYPFLRHISVVFSSLPAYTKCKRSLVVLNLVQLVTSADLIIYD